MPPEIFPQELRDPDYVETLASMSYLEKLNDELVKKVKALTDEGKRIPNELRKKMMLVG